MSRKDDNSLLAKLHAATSLRTRFWHAVDDEALYSPVMRWCRESGGDYVGGVSDGKCRVLATQEPTFLNSAEISVITAARVAEVIVGGESVRTSESWRSLVGKNERTPYGRTI